MLHIIIIDTELQSLDSSRTSAFAVNEWAFPEREWGGGGGERDRERDLKNFNHPTRGNFVVVMVGS